MESPWKPQGIPEGIPGESQQNPQQGFPTETEGNPDDIRDPHGILIRNPSRNPQEILITKSTGHRQRNPRQGTRKGLF